MGKTLDLAPSEIRIDGGTQPRTKISEEVVAEYVAAMQAGATFPPAVIFHDGAENWLADGFHRWHAANKIGAASLLCDVRVGTRRDAVLYSVGANDSHGLRRTNDDKRKAVMTLLGDEEWTKWSDHEIARRCGVSAPFVGDLRRGFRTRSVTGGGRSLETTSSEPRTFTSKHGTVTQMNTANIGQRGDDKKKPRDQRAIEIRELAEKGNRATQIASRLGIGETRVRLIAQQEGITLPDTALGKPRKVDHSRAIEQTVMSLEASAQGLITLGISVDGISADMAADWAKSIAESIKVFVKLKNDLTGVANAKAA